MCYSSLQRMEEFTNTISRRCKITKDCELRKTKRVRTSFKHYQIAAMKQAFREKPNPDANDLKNLSTETGLSKRVLQVILDKKLDKNVKI